MAGTARPWAYSRRNWRNEPDAHNFYITGDRHAPDGEDESDYSTAVAIVCGNATAPLVTIFTTTSARASDATSAGKGLRGSAEMKAAEYRNVSGFPGYRVGDDGSVWTCKSSGSLSKPTGIWRQLRPSKGRNGRRIVGICRNGKVKLRAVAHLVLEAFVGPRPTGMECCHYNDNPSDNRLSNLRWDTRSSNIRDQIRNGRRFDNSGVNHPFAIIRDETVRCIRRMERAGWTIKQTAYLLKLSVPHVRSIRCGYSWKHIV